jgi:hypothetical protein
MAKKSQLNRRRDEVILPLYQQVLQIFVEEGGVPAGYHKAHSAPYDIGWDGAGIPVAVRKKARPGRARENG